MLVSTRFPAPVICQPFITFPFLTTHFQAFVSNTSFFIKAVLDEQGLSSGNSCSQTTNGSACRPFQPNNTVLYKENVLSDRWDTIPY
jgi:hypothetical protein